MRSRGNWLSSSIRAPMGAMRSSATRATVSANSSCSGLRTGNGTPPTDHSFSGSLTVLGRGRQRRRSPVWRWWDGPMPSVSRPPQATWAVRAWLAGVPAAVGEGDELLGVVGERLADLRLPGGVVVVEVPEEISEAGSGHTRTLLLQTRGGPRHSDISRAPWYMSPPWHAVVTR